MVLKTHNQQGEASMWQLVQALDYAISRDIKVVNMSLAYWSPTNANGKPSIMQYLIDFAKTYKGMLFVAAAGNDSLNIDQPVLLNNGMQLNYRPASLPNDNLIVVAAGTCTNQLASFSNYGPVNVDIAAPGIEIYSALLDGTYGYLTGTSMAAPHVTAAAALAGSKQSVFDWKRIKYDLLNRTTPSPSLANVVSSGRMLTFCDNYIPGSSPLLVTAVADKVLCIGGNSTLTARATGGLSPYTYSWSNGNSGVSTTVTNPGVYTVTVTDASGNSASETVQVYGASAPLAEFELQSISCGENCANLEIKNATPGSTFLWSTNQVTPVIRICPWNTTTYSVVTTTANGCTSLSSISVPNFQPRITALKDTSICPCSSATLNAIVKGGIGPLDYEWSPGSDTTPSIAVSPAIAETYTVEVSDSRGCKVVSSSTVTPKCFAPTAISVVYNTQTQETLFTWAKGPCAINRTQIRWRCNPSSAWTIVTISDTSKTTRSVATPPGCTLEWQVRSRCCNNVNSAWSTPPSLRITESMDEQPKVSLHLYPNPASSVIHVDADQAGVDNKAYVYNAYGQFVMVKELPESTLSFTLDIEKLSPGYYHLRYGSSVASFSIQ
jgi:hypothetical protein